MITLLGILGALFVVAAVVDIRARRRSHHPGVEVAERAVDPA
jgi:hypothetical protein